MGQMVKHLPSKYKALSFSPIIAKQNNPKTNIVNSVPGTVQALGA
jgi:hypothetical protein